MSTSGSPSSHIQRATGVRPFVRLRHRPVEVLTKSKRRFRKSVFEVNDPRRIARRASTLNQIATWFNHDVCFGTYTWRACWAGEDG
jgi:hypothetical protein